MVKCLVAITQLKLNLRFGENGEPARHALQAFLLDPSEEWRPLPLDLAYPGSAAVGETGDFVVSAVGDLDGDGGSALVYGVTRNPGDCYVMAYRCEDSGWRASPIIKALPSTGFLRSIALGDLDGDGTAEIVLGTRPNGAVIVLDGGPTDYVSTVIDRDQYGAGTTNTREVLVADVDCDGALEVVAATARAGSEQWHATPGAIIVYRRSGDGWQKSIIEDHGGRTHTRMLAVADVRNDGVAHIVSSAVGVVDPQTGRVILEPELCIHSVSAGRVQSQAIGTLEGMIKSRSFGAGDIDGNGRRALVVGTRALGTPGLETTALFVYRFDPQTKAWERETLDTSGPLGFHCVAIGDIDGDGQSEVIASDDGRGLVKVYKRQGKGWRRETIHDAKGVIFCTAIHVIELSAPLV